jgi:endonuclease/exonuclease/phosphatase family metal-dependent hydrolase
MKLFKISIKILFFIIAINVLYLGGIIIFGTLTDYKPADKVQLPITGNGNKNVLCTDTLTFLSWNIGFCGLGAEMDFFYDGGKMVRPSKDQIAKFTNGIMQFLKQNQNTDFIILQEVDENSSRTKGQNEIEEISLEMPDYFYSYDDNYKVKFVPIPYTNPLGRVEAGQMNLSKAKPVSSERIAYRSAYAWPKRLFMLDRCFIVSRFILENGKQLVLMNTHNSAYDAGGKLRMVEMPVIRELMIKEFEKGNYVISGGDWNQNPPDYDPEKVYKTYPPVKGIAMKGNFFPENWNIVYDPGIPSNREIDAPLQKGKTTSTIIDYYILSPNIEALEIITHQLDFEFSDHNPVSLKVRLIK